MRAGCGERICRTPLLAWMGWACISAVSAIELEAEPAGPPLAGSPFSSERRWRAPHQVQPSRESKPSSADPSQVAVQGLLRDWRYVGYASRGAQVLAWVERSGRMVQLKVGDSLSSEGAVVVAISPARLQLRQAKPHGALVEHLWPYLGRQAAGATLEH